MTYKFLRILAISISLIATGIANAGNDIKSVTVELDILQKRAFGGYIDHKKATELATIVVNEILEEAGVLNEKSEQQATLYIGYYRRFDGDETPFPVNNLSAPEFSDGYIIYNNGTPVLQRHNPGSKLAVSGLLTIFKKDQAGKQGKNFKRDLLAISSASALAAETLVAGLYDNRKKFKAFAKSKHATALAAHNRFYEQLDDSTTPEFASLNDSPSYIPMDVIAEYRDRVANEDETVRRAAYKELVLNPVNDKTLLDKISLNLQTAPLTGASADTQAWAAKALGASGFAEYREPLETIAKVATSKKVQKHAKRAFTDIGNNPTYPLTLHDTSNEQKGQGWKSLQLVNQINSGRLRIQTAAAKQVFRSGKAADSLVIKALSEQLLFSSMRPSIRATVSSEFHAWAMKAIAAAGDKQYLPLLERIAKYGLTKKTRKYAKASKKVLKKA